MKNEFRNWILSFLLSLPVLFFLLCHFFYHSDNLTPTGFIQYDNVSYVGNAQQYLNQTKPSLFYANRLNDSENYRKIYFQPQHLALAGLMWTGLPPGLALCIFNYIFTIIFFRILIALFYFLYPSIKYKNLLLILFAWGGGIFALSGWILYFLNLTKGRTFSGSSLFLDPADGWWGLNLGRSLFFSLEVYYHTLFFSTIYLILKKKWKIATVFAVLLSLSHPFTGIEVLLIIITWCLFERLLCKNRTIPLSFITAISLVIVFHIWYYLFFLNQFPEHKAVFQQYRLKWKLRFYHFIPAYILVGAGAFVSIKKADSLKIFLANSNNRLFICWAAVAFLLVNHELFIPPMQPVHFTRGYIWSALFLLAVPGISYIMERLNQTISGKAVFAGLIAIFLLDNANWIHLNTGFENKSHSTTVIDAEQKELLHFLTQSTNEQTLIVGSGDATLYLSTVYIKAYIWISHPYNTPFYKKKSNEYENYIKNGTIPAGWEKRELLFIANKTDTEEMSRYRQWGSSVKKTYETENYLLYKPIR